MRHWIDASASGMTVPMPLSNRLNVYACASALVQGDNRVSHKFRYTKYYIENNEPR